MLSLLVLVRLAPTRSVYAAPPAQDAPTVDGRIQLVWPHDEQGNYVPGFGSYVNVEVYLFERDTLNPVPCDFDLPVRLHWAQNGTSGRPPYGSIRPAHQQVDREEGTVAREDGVLGERQTRTMDGKTFTYWLFNDVPTGYDPRGGIQPSYKNYYYVTVEGANARSNVWGHAAFDILTYLPFPDTPDAIVDVPPAMVDTFLNVVWPHDGAGNARPVTEALLANVSVDITAHADDLSRDPWNSVGFDFAPPVRLLRSLNDGFLEPVPTTAVVAEGDAPYYIPDPPRFPRWVFNDVDVSAAQDPANRYYFMALVDGVETHPTIWAHGADPRTYFPERDVPARSCE